MRVTPKCCLSVMLLLVTTACMTAANNGHRDPTLPDVSDEKTGARPTVNAAPNPVPPPAPVVVKSEVPPAPTTDEQLAFVRKQTSPTTQLAEGDYMFVAQLPSTPPAGSVAEAALAIGLVKTVAQPLHGSAASFQETDLAKAATITPPPGAPPALSPGAPSGLSPGAPSSLTPGAPPPASPTTPGAPAAADNKAKITSLEQLCKQRGLNLPDALAENPLLGSAGFAKQVLAALNIGENTPDFKKEISLALRKQAGLWSELSGGVAAPDAATALGAAAATSTPPAPPAAAATTAPPESLPPSPAELAGGENVLAEAQALADRGDYAAAIKRVAAVPEGNPLRPQAQEKLKEYSNLAVQELRKKAALAFQTAMPVTDNRTRAEYLRQAKAFLEDAIKNYPDATQLPTVRDNLRIISRDLENLETEGAAKKG